MKKPRLLQYILLYKPYDVLCQFTDIGTRSTLAQFGPFPKDVYPAGRLDTDSEGLVLLTNDGDLKHGLLNPRFGHPRTYLVQVERVPGKESLDTMRSGIIVEGRKTLPAEVTLLEREPLLLPRPVPIRFRKNVPTAWIQITLREGRNHQVRKMTAAVGHPTLRLVRIGIGTLVLGNLRPGEKRELTAKELAELQALIRDSR